jgi:hypothetical protein
MEININDLPKYSNWPHRILGLSEFKKKKKTKSEILREFDIDKWGDLLKKISSSNLQLSLKEVENLMYNESDHSICLINNRLVKMSPYDAFKEQYRITLETISSFMPATSLCELGAGYGQIILNLAKESIFANTKIIAAEYTMSGVKLLQHISESEKIDIVSGYCDLGSPKITKINIPKNGIIFTSYAAHYINANNIKWVEAICLLNPSIVIHFEPIYQHYNKESLLGAMQCRYMELNDYNCDLLLVLKHAENNGLIEIVKELPLVTASNPFMPISVIAWKPIL